MDLYPAPLSITKRASLSTVRLEHDYLREPVPTRRRNSSIQSSVPDSSSDATVLASHSPPLLAGRQSLDIPKVRRRNAKYESQYELQPIGKGNHRRGLTLPTYNATHTPEGQTGDSSLSSSPFPVESHLQYQQVGDKGDSQLQTQGRLSQFFHALDKKLGKHSTRGFSRRFSSNIHSTQPETQDPNYNVHSPLKYHFAPPISVVNMEMHIDELLSNPRGTETSVRIAIMANVNMESGQSIQYSLNIDALILLNMTSDSDMIRVPSMAQIIIDKLKARDSFTVACVNFERQDFIDVLYSPSEGHTLDLKCLVSECGSIGKQLLNGVYRDDDLLGDAVETASRFFDARDHSVPHIFLVSANHDTTLSTAYNSAVGLTTVTLEDHYDFGPTPRLGWHICHELNSDPSSSVGFQNRVEKALCHIRSGFTPGTITNLHLRLKAGIECDIQVCGRTSIASLRPGETWKILVRVSIVQEQGFDRLERDIKTLLHCNDVPGDMDHRKPALVATLTFNHSLQPTCSSKIVKSCRATRG